MSTREASAAGAKLQIRDADSQVQSGLAADRNRLQGDRTARTAHQDVCAQTSAERRFGGAAGIFTGESAARNAARREDGPENLTARGGAEIQTEPADHSGIDLLQAAGVPERAD